MNRLVILGALLVLAAACWPADVRAQQAQSGTLRGVVRSTLGDAIPYAVVALEPGSPRHFTDDSGTFTFPGLAPGTYHLRARQVGYKPFDTTVVVARGSAVVVVASLEHLVVELEEIRVVARASRWGRCTDPGPPDAASTPDVAAIFDQLRQNAERYWLLAHAYPAVYRMERRFGRPGYTQPGVVVKRTDTVDLRTDARWGYAPGRVVVEEPRPGGTDLQVNLPTLPDFADSTFLANHCFRVGGIESVDGARHVRLDFRAAEAIRDPDANGSAYLDPDTYLIRFVRVQLTRPELAMAGLEGLEATVTFREIVPSLVLPDHISSVQSVVDGLRHVETVEEQQTVDFHFLQALPTRRP
ncbi:MAG TPA: carboxypeptidase-like regulatory domain-containing protein [Gemmatimonadales bacterium]|nr:carboxypeptidase-like regulatory domain-containing protein [Gemmatimonadales bacterium]